MTKRAITVKVGNSADVSPVALLVQVASQFESEIYVEDGSRHFNAKSIMGMMTLGLSEGKVLTLAANGSDEIEAIDQIESYLVG